MNTKLRIALALLSCFVVVGSTTLYVTGYIPEFLKTEKVPVVQVPPVPIEEPFVLKPYNFPYPAVDSSDWQTVNIKSQGISFKMPKDWILEGCGAGLEVYKLLPCENGPNNIERGLSISLSRKKALRGEGEAGLYAISIWNQKLDLANIIKRDRQYIGRSFPNSEQIKFVGIFQSPVQGIEGIFSVTETIMGDESSNGFDIRGNYKNKSVEIGGSEASFSLIKRGTFKAFLDSIRFTN